MALDLDSFILLSTQASEIKKSETMQSLWSGYGAITRYELSGSAIGSVVGKHIRMPHQQSHPRGWNTPFSHHRKIKSYQVESHWYRHFASQCDDSCRVAMCFGVEASDQEFLILLEDMDSAGFPLRLEAPNLDQMKCCLHWLANFHATFLECQTKGLWETGTYWHLETRPDELEKLEDFRLKDAAFIIDKRLKETAYQTLVHGDAKLANFCFSDDYEQVAAVDFQYVGGGCGMKDVAYFIGSCLRETDCEEYEGYLLDIYFSDLKKAILAKQPHINPDKVEQAWRPLFHWAWTDFHRFLKGWSPGHWKLNEYSEKLCRKVLEEIDAKQA